MKGQTSIYNPLLLAVAQCLQKYTYNISSKHFSYKGTRYVPAGFLSYNYKGTRYNRAPASPNAGNQRANAGNQSLNAGNQRANAGNQRANAGNQRANAGNQSPNAGNQGVKTGSYKEITLRVWAQVFIHQYIINFKILQTWEKTQTITSLPTSICLKHGENNLPQPLATT